MMILEKNRGISSFMEICDIKLSGGYEEKMITANDLEFVPHTELREIDGERSIYVKIDGMCTLSDHYSRFKPGRKDVESLVQDIKRCLLEIREYLLNPEGLILNLNYILYSDAASSHRFMYVPGYHKSFKSQIKDLFEEIMRMYDHKDRAGVVYLYDTYSRFLGENFTPEMFCKLAENSESSEPNMISESRMLPPPAKEEKEVHDIKYDEPEMDVKKPEDSKADNKIYILLIAAVIVVSIVLYIFFGMKSLKFTAISFAMVITFIVVDIVNRKKEEEIDESMKEIKIEKKENRFKEIKDSKEKNYKEEKTDKEDLDDKEDKADKEDIKINKEKNLRIVRETDTSVLVDEDGTRIISKLVPCDDTEGEQIYLIEGETRIGRLDSACDYCIDDPSISRVHAIIEKHGSKVFLKDAGSTNGTYLNDTRLRGDKIGVLSYGDMISLANIRYKCL